MKKTTKKSKTNIQKTLENKVLRKRKDRYVLQLFVAGITPRSLKAIANIRNICDQYLKDRVDLEIIDIYQNPIIARDGQIVAAPTLIKEMPLPIRRFIGDMSDTKKLIVGLDLKSK